MLNWIRALGLGLVLSTGLAVENASAFHVSGRVWVTPTWVRGEVCNPNLSTALSCTVYAQGIAVSVYNGAYQMPVFAQNNVVIAPGQCASADVYTVGPWAIQAWGAQAWGLCQYFNGTGW